MITFEIAIENYEKWSDIWMEATNKSDKKNAAIQKEYWMNQINTLF